MMRAVSSLPGKFPVGAFFDDTFGTSDACLRRLLSSGKVSAFRGHLAWTNHQKIPVQTLIPRAQKLNALAAEYPGVAFYASAVCEHYLTAFESAAVNAALRPYLPNVKGIVDSGSKAYDATAIRETHGPSGPGTPFASLDGQSAVDVDVEAFKKRGLYFALIWDRSFNCRFADRDKRAPQTRTDCPNQDQFNLIVRYAYPQPAWPAGERLASNEIWKPSAENYGGCKGRMCKPVAILNTPGKTIEVQTLSGQKIVTMTYGGPFGRGQSRYYSPLTAFQIGQFAEARSGSEFVVLVAGKRRIVVNAYRRAGSFRG